MDVVYEDLKEVNAPYMEALKEAAIKVLDSGWYVLGEEVARFESHFAQYLQREYCIGVASGLDALTLSLKACELPAGGEVILPSNAYIADVLAVEHAGLTPVLAEPDLATYNIDPNTIEQAITANTVAILPVHFYGQAADMAAINALSRHYGLKVIEDCAHAHGARLNGKKVGALADVSAFSFYPTKNLGGFGDGGAVLTDDANIASNLKALRNYGSEVKNVHTLAGHNSRLDTLQAVLLDIKLKSLDKANAHKRQLATYYQENLPESLIKPVLIDGAEGVFHIYAVRHPERDRIREQLQAKGIQTLIHYPTPVYAQPAFAQRFEGHYPISDEIHATVFSLPISSAHTVEDVEYVTNVIKELDL